MLPGPTPVHNSGEILIFLTGPQVGPLPVIVQDPSILNCPVAFVVRVLRKVLERSALHDGREPQPPKRVIGLTGRLIPSFRLVFPEGNFRNPHFADTDDIAVTSKANVTLSALNALMLGLLFTQLIQIGVGNTDSV